MRMTCSPHPPGLTGAAPLEDLPATSAEWPIEEPTSVLGHTDFPTMSDVEEAQPRPVSRRLADQSAAAVRARLHGDG